MENTIQKPNKGLDVTILVIKILYIIAYVGFTAFMIFTMASSGADLFADPQANSAGFAIVFSLVILIFGVIGYSILLCMGLLGLILSLVNKRSIKRKANIILFSIFTALPVITEVIFILVGYAILNAV